MSQQFYHYFCKKWDETFDYTDSSFLDGLIAQKNAYLRFVGSTKPNGLGLLTLVNDNHTFEMSLIRPPITSQTINEQCVSYANLKISPNFTTITTTKLGLNKSSVNDTKIKTKFNLSYLDAFVFKSKEITNSETIYKFQRKCTSMCVICKRKHDSSDAYIKISNGAVSFHCYRNDNFLVIDTNLPFEKSHHNNNNKIKLVTNVLPTSNLSQLRIII